MFDVTVVGAGPSGLRVAQILARKGYKVLVLEEHEKIGLPVKCTGLVSDRLLELVPELSEEDGVILNQIKKAKFYWRGDFFELISGRRKMLVIDRRKFDEILAEKAKWNGAKILLGKKVTGLKITEFGVHVYAGKKEYRSKLLVGSDGADSFVARNLNMELPDEVVYGLQTTVEGKFDDSSVEVHFDASEKLFGWVVPVSDKVARVGVADSKRNLAKAYRRFLKKRLGYYKKPDVGGKIRFGLIKESAFYRGLLVGDAASQVKPFSGGGIIYGLISAGYAAKALIKSLKVYDYSKEFFVENYDKEWKKHVGKGIRKGMLLRKLFYSYEPSKSLSFKLAKALKFLISNWDPDLI